VRITVFKAETIRIGPLCHRVKGRVN